MSPLESAPRGASQAVPLTVLTGFLGAGKTTLLSRILNGDHGLRVAVLVNDFGAINIDADLVVGVEGDVISLANGCVCCSIRGDLIDAVTRVLARSECPEYVRKMEIDPAKYNPPEVDRPLVLEMPTIKMILEAKVKEKIEKIKSKFTKGDE